MSGRVGRVRTIYRAFFKKSKINKDTLEHRREMCRRCPFNSDNSSTTSLGWFKALRKRFMVKPFCTMCGCFIKEKTASMTEACALEDQGMDPMWYRVFLETLNKNNMNLVNKSEKLVNPRITEDGTIILDYGKIKRSALADIDVSLEVGEGLDLKITNCSYGCSACMRVTYHKTDINKYNAHIWINWERIQYKFRKPIVVTYKVNKKEYKQAIEVIGEIIR